MAINQETVEKTIRLTTETASRRTVFERVILDDGNGNVAITFPASVTVQKTTLEADANDKPIAIYETVELGTFALTPDELMTFWAIPIKRLDTGETGAFGEVMAALIDQIIALKLAPPPPGATPALK